MTPSQKSTLEIGALIAAGAAILWYITSTAGSVQSTANQQLPVYGGAANPGIVAATLPSVAPISGWNTAPDLPPVNYGGLGADALRQFLSVLNPNAGNCGCGNPCDTAQALVSATPGPYSSAGTTAAPYLSDAGIYPPQGAIFSSDLAPQFT